MRRTMHFALSILLLLYDCQSAAYPRKLKITIAKASCTISYTWKLGYYRIFVYSRALSSTASSCTDLAGARFWIGSKNIWDVHFCLRCTFFGRFLYMSTWDTLYRGSSHFVISQFVTIANSWFWCKKKLFFYFFWFLKFYFLNSTKTDIFMQIIILFLP